jgi:acetoin utilization deacetylase AcuC-like enzyme
MPDQGMGFCAYNNVVVAARHAQRAHGVSKVMTLDWDVHHGNGTQTAFLGDPNVLFISLHQDDLYPPGWGAVDQAGEGKGEGTTVNIPLPAGTGNVGYLCAFERIVLPVAIAFRPELVIVSAGQDANVNDPLARMTLTTLAYREMTKMMMDVAAECCDGRLVIAQEGGYAPTYAPYCTASIAETLAGAGSGALPIGEPYGPRAVSLPPNRTLGLDAGQAIDRAVSVQRQFWPL